jgi:phosphate butyryltransferase
LSFDIAVSKESAAIKKHPSKITGEVDILLVPSVSAGNILCKGLLYFGGAKMAGCVLGAKVPIVLTSRGATSEEKLLSIMLCLKSV